MLLDPQAMKQGSRNSRSFACEATQLGVGLCRREVTSAKLNLLRGRAR